jgi:hypothetical protein
MCRVDQLFNRVGVFAARCAGQHLAVMQQVQQMGAADTKECFEGAQSGILVATQLPGLNRVADQVLHCHSIACVWPSA